MSAFKDDLGRHWSITLTINVIDRIHAATGIDLIGGTDLKPFDRLMIDPVMIIDALFVCCTSADSFPYTKESFASVITGETIEAAAAAFLAAAEEFYPDPEPETQTNPDQKPKTVRESVYAAAGIIGIDPGPLSCRQLKWMLSAREAMAWELIAWLSHIIFVAAPFRKGDAPTPAQLNPLSKATQKTESGSWEHLVAAFGGVILPPGIRITTERN